MTEPSGREPENLCERKSAAKPVRHESGKHVSGSPFDKLRAPQIF